MLNSSSSLKISGTPSFTGMRRCTIVVPAWNALHYLQRTIPSMKRAAIRHGDAAVVVVDNGSTDGTGEYLRREHPDIVVISIPRQSIGAARNIGARAVDSSTIAFVDADCLMAEDHLVAAERILTGGSIHITGNSYDLPEDPQWIERTWYYLHKRTADGITRLIPAGNFVITREAFEAVGGFDEKLTTGEDAEFCQRLSCAGYHPFASSSVRVMHLGNPKSLRAFYSQNVWHSLGMFGTARTNLLDRPLLMTAAHLVLTVGTLFNLVNPAVPLSIRLCLLFLSQLIAPMATVVYRLVSEGGGITRHNVVPEVARALLLSWLY
mgnify:CR=1 FL=1